ncbi:MAG TPA: dTDP-4-dehydrorhamnose 3,5-epimerase [Mycobacteriales bacterium]|nr:dTDP-4-dehydrorhamnose 3,5-epimerase [Mycobacteriales bacterium]
MKTRQLAVPGAWEFTPDQHGDGRGLFLEWLREDVLTAAIGHPLRLAQANHSVSRRGTVRAVHYADVPPSQAKYVYCPRGAILDVVVDIRVGSPTFGRYDTVRLDEVDRRAVYVAEGLGHGFVALADDSTLTYLCSEPYNPAREHTVNALDPELGLPWPTDLELLLSPRDRAAPGLAEARASGALPDYDDCQRYYHQLRSTPVGPA